MPIIESKKLDYTLKLTLEADCGFDPQNRSEVEKTFRFLCDHQGVFVPKATMDVARSSDVMFTGAIVYHANSNILLFAEEREGAGYHLNHDIKKHKTFNDFIKDVCSLQKIFKQKLLE